MHIILALITGLAGLIWALVRLQNSGINLNAFNPFFWARRRAWAKQLGTKPLHNLQNSMEAAAVLAVAIAEADGTVTRESKQETLQLFMDTFGISRDKATELYAASSYLLRDTADPEQEVDRILAPTLSEFQENQITKLMAMLETIAQQEDGPSMAQQGIIDTARKQFKAPEETSTHW